MTTAEQWRSTSVPTQFARVVNRYIAYRMLGAGATLILCTRFRGTLDTWDPAFLDHLAERFRVVTFDYSGIGLSTGVANYDPISLAQDVIALADAIGADRFVVGGWSLGGQAAQVVTTVWPERVTHLVLLSSIPPGYCVHGPTPAFSASLLKPFNNLDEEITLYFDPMSAESREAAEASRRRMALRDFDRSPDVAEWLYLRLLKESTHDDAFYDDGGYRETLEKTQTPILAISGDRDVGFPMENWFTLTRKWRSLYLTVFPRSGNGVHHQYPAVSARLVASFVDITSRSH